MGAQYYFHKPVKASDVAVKNTPGATREVDLFTWSDELHLRISNVGDENSGQGPTVALSKADAVEMLKALQFGMAYLGYDK
jgi:hypothetical protein